MADPKIGEEFIEQGAQKVTGRDIQQVVDHSEEIRRRFVGGPLRRFVDDGQLLLSLVRDYWTRTYRQMPYGTLAAAVFTLIYVFNPFDLLPDVLPIVGQIDDAAVVAACLLLIEQDLQTYRQWKQGRQQIRG